MALNHKLWSHIHILADWVVGMGVSPEPEKFAPEHAPFVAGMGSRNRTKIGMGEYGQNGYGYGCG